MTKAYLDRLVTPSVAAAQAANGSGGMASPSPAQEAADRFTEAETAFVAGRDSFYMASVSESGWPYIQHRGGPPGFLKVLDDQTLGFADFRGNRQYISIGNVAADDRVSLILLDYPRRARLKVLAHAEVRSLEEDADLAVRLATPGYRGKAERAILLRIEAFDWNCPQHITPRYTQAEVAEALGPTRERLALLEAENEDLRRRLALLTDA